MNLKELLNCIRDNNKKVLVVGIGESGFSCSSLLVRKGYEVYAHDENINERVLKRADELTELGVKCCLGQPDLKKINMFSLVVVSPGVPPFSPVVRTAVQNKIPVASELDVAWQLMNEKPLKTVAITGTNGKTTVTSLTYEILKSQNEKVMMGGNIGRPLSDMVDEVDSNTILVLEVSSFQLYYSFNFSPDAGAILNITPDHLDWHSSMEEYVESKKHLIDLVKPDGWLVLNAEDVHVRNFSPKGNQKVIWFSSKRTDVSENCAFLRDERAVLKVKGKEVLKVDRSLFKGIGVHNTENLLASMSMAWICGAESKAVLEAITRYGLKPHRLQKVFEIHNGKIVFYDDSKATNSDATLKALESLEGNVICLLGGRAKETNYSDLGELIARKGCIPVVFGEAREILKRDIERFGVKVYEGENLEKAVYLATALAVSISAGIEPDLSTDPSVLFKKAKDLLKKEVKVVLSPACASFDEFSGYAERGDRFLQYIKKIAEKAGIP